MNKIEVSIVEEAKIYVSNLLDNDLSKDCLFHTKKHTMDVLRNTEIIGYRYRYQLRLDGRKHRTDAQNNCSHYQFLHFIISLVHQSPH